MTHLWMKYEPLMNLWWLVLGAIMNQSWIKHESCMNNSRNKHGQVTIWLCTNYEPVMNHEWLTYEPLMDQSWIDHESIIRLPLRQPPFHPQSGLLRNYSPCPSTADPTEGSAVWKLFQTGQTGFLGGATVRILAWSVENGWSRKSHRIYLRMFVGAGYLNAVWPEISRTVFGRPNLDLQTHLKRRGSPCGAGCAKNQPGIPILRPLRGAQQIRPDNPQRFIGGGESRIANWARSRALSGP